LRIVGRVSTAVFSRFLLSYAQEAASARFLYKKPKVSLSKEQLERRKAAKREADALKESQKREQSRRRKRV